MKWITREYVKVDRVACPWLIKKFVDKNAEFIFAPADEVMEEAKRLDAIPYDVKNVELGHHGKECSFEAILKKYKLTNDPALVLLGKIATPLTTTIRSIDSQKDPALRLSPKAFGILALKTIMRSTRRSGSSTMRSTLTAKKWYRQESRMVTSSDFR
jgi:hypothetical protein